MSIRFIFFIVLMVMNALPEDLEAQGNKEETKKVVVPDTPTVSRHSIALGGKKLEYTVRTGYVKLEADNGDDQAYLFYVAYTLDGINDLQKRPLTFSFNGGPGSSSVWLHLGILGPRRVLMTDEGNSLPPPYQLVDNDYSWLDMTDMVFIDPVSTGFSRTPSESDSRRYHGYEGDIRSVGEFIRRFTTENQRWNSPKYLIGESYGTTRAAGLSSHLINECGLYLNGIILVSSVMDFQTVRFDTGNDLPYVLFLPTYAASAHFHGRLAPEHLQRPLPEFLDEVERFAANEYAVALFKGNLLTAEERASIVERLHAYTGISKTYIERANLRLVIHNFTKELLRDDSQAIGRFDSRYKHVETSANASGNDLDPSYQPTILGCYATLINDYLTRELGFRSHLTYNILTGKVQPWDYAPYSNQYLTTSNSLAKAMQMNPHMKIWIANGYYDLATPYFATEYTVNHLNIDPALQKNIKLTYYPAGHMMYLQKRSLVQMREDAKAFFKN